MRHSIASLRETELKCPFLHNSPSSFFILHPRKKLLVRTSNHTFFSPHPYRAHLFQDEDTTLQSRCNSSFVTARVKSWPIYIFTRTKLARRPSRTKLSSFHEGKTSRKFSLKKKITLFLFSLSLLYILDSKKKRLNTIIIYYIQIG